VLGCNNDATVLKGRVERSTIFLKTEHSWLREGVEVEMSRNIKIRAVWIAGNRYEVRLAKKLRIGATTLLYKYFIGFLQ
jgi:hypothetical protein